LNLAGDVFLDARMLDQDRGGFLYTELQDARSTALYAITALKTYAPATSATRRGELYALMGYEEIMLADFFCSGVPLSTLDFRGDFTYQAGSTTDQVYEHAATLFDSALALVADSAPLTSLARVGQGRAYLNLGQYVKAEQAVNGIPIGFQYADSILSCGLVTACPTFGGASNDTSLKLSYALFQLSTRGSVADLEGGVGLPFISSGVPRTAVTMRTSAISSYPIYWPAKYNISGVSVIPIATGIEAQLIAAEAAIHAGHGSAAIAMLNALRRDSALTASLPDIPDPLNDAADVDTLFAERAAWLFLTGQRQGDLRRLIRQYQRSNVYPSGAYPGLGAYGDFVDDPIPDKEFTNPLFQGCLSRD
jgi:hypothetical protein